MRLLSIAASAFQSTHPAKGDTLVVQGSAKLMLYFNPLIPRREIQQYCTKICHYIFAVLPKIIRFPCLLFQKSSNFFVLTEKNNLLSGANPPYISCELPVRTWIIFTVHNHLLLSNCITSFIFYALILYQNEDNLIILHIVKISGRTSPIEQRFE